MPVETKIPKRATIASLSEIIKDLKKENETLTETLKSQAESSARIIKDMETQLKNVGTTNLLLNDRQKHYENIVANVNAFVKLLEESQPKLKENLHDLERDFHLVSGKQAFVNESLAFFSALKPEIEATK